MFFVTVAFRIGTDCNSIRRIIHIGVPKIMEEYCKEVGWPARANSYYNSYNISEARKNMSDVMKTYDQSKECKRKLILNYFDHEVPKDQPQDHTFCDFHSTHCQCEDCMLVNVANQVGPCS